MPVRTRRPATAREETRAGPRTETDVLIVGGGPVGLALALDLAYRGVGCIVADAGDGSVRHPKVSTIGPRSMELFRRWGVADAIRDAGWPADHPLDVAWVTRVGGHEIHRYRRGTAARRPAFAHTPEPDQMCPAHWLTPVLTRAVGVHGSGDHPAGPLRLRTTVGRVRQADDHVDATLTDHATGTTGTVRARYVVACDGAASPVRRACGIDAPARHRPQVFRNVLFRAPRLRDQLGDRAALVYFLVLSPTLRFPMRSLNGRDLYNLVVGAGHGTGDGSDAGSDGGAGSDGVAHRADALSLIREVLAVDTPVELLGDAEWHLTHRVADRYRAGRVFLAGDAAHTLSPSGGFGLNTGIGDAADLGWKLAATLDGWAGPGLLDAYGTERRPIALESLAEANLNLQRTLSRHVPPEIHLDGPEGERARAALAEQLQASDARREFDAPEIHFGLRYRSPLIVEDPGVPVRPGRPEADWRPGSEPGYRAAHAWWAPATSTLDLFGHGFVLLHLGGTAEGGETGGETGRGTGTGAGAGVGAWTGGGRGGGGGGDGGGSGIGAVERAFAARAVPLTVRSGGGRAVAALYGRTFVLVRPDGHVAWRGDTLPPDPGTLADTVRGAGTGPAPGSPGPAPGPDGG